MDLADARGLRFRCLEGCGFCCTTSPQVLPRERAALTPSLLVERADGTLGVRLAGGHCAALDAARRCGVYGARPSACRAFPVHLHALDDVQATLHRGCPGLRVPDGDTAETLVAPVRWDPKAVEAARANWREFRRRAEAVDLWDDPAELRVLATALSERAWTKRDIERLYDTASGGDLRADSAIEAVDASEPEVAARRLLADVAEETFAGDLPQLVSGPRFDWVRAVWDGEGLARHGTRADGTVEIRPAVRIGDLPLWRFRGDAKARLAKGLVRLLHRDLALGAAAKLVDLMGYEVTLASAYVRVLADQAAGLTLRAALLAHGDGASAAGPEHADEALAWQETAFLALPTVGAVL